MSILVAEDDAATRRILELTLAKQGHQVRTCANGEEAWQVIHDPNPPSLLILDWMMPGVDGIEICRRIRAQPKYHPVYLILLTARSDKGSVVEGLRSGADDYVSKPFDSEELQARVNVGLRMLELQQKLADRVSELELAMAQVKRLQGLLPICMYCKKIRNDENYWQEVESYLAKFTQASFSHGVCPECYEKHLLPELERLRQQPPLPM
jgi:phosphoserine phosphatase RsbU/P